MRQLKERRYAARYLNRRPRDARIIVSRLVQHLRTTTLVAFGLRAEDMKLVKPKKISLTFGLILNSFRMLALEIYLSPWAYHVLPFKLFCRILGK